MARYFILDVFTSEIFRGNPLAVVFDGESFSAETMQKVAREFNLSETAFVLPPTDNRATRRLRIFTPSHELPLAGHPVIGTWFLLGLQRELRLNQGWNLLYQEIPAGVLPVEIKLEESTVTEVRMTQATPEYFENIEDRPVLAEALGIPASELDDSLPAQFVSTGMKQLMVPIRSLDSLRRINPVPTLLSQILAPHDSHLCYPFTFQRGAFPRTCHARAFAPQLGVPEDPATGSAAGALGAYLWKHRRLAEPLTVEQGREVGRGATIRVTVSDDGSTVKIAGCAVLVASGTLLV